MEPCDAFYLLKSIYTIKMLLSPFSHWMCSFPSCVNKESSGPHCRVKIFFINRILLYICKHAFWYFFHLSNNSCFWNPQIGIHTTHTQALCTIFNWRLIVGKNLWRTGLKYINFNAFMLWVQWRISCCSKGDRKHAMLCQYSWRKQLSTWTTANLEKSMSFFPPVKTTCFSLPFSAHVCKLQLTRYQRWFVSWGGLSPWCCLLVTPRICLTHCFLCRYSLDAEMELDRETANNVHGALPKIPAPTSLLPLHLLQ